VTAVVAPKTEKAMLRDAALQIRLERTTHVAGQWALVSLVGEVEEGR
jgi:hypothetical protein